FATRTVNLQMNNFPGSGLYESAKAEFSGMPAVVELQGRLRQVALYTGVADGQYGAAVRDAVARYQRTYGVHGDPDGVYGPATRASLEARTPQP
ncbi:peptidoglycan-binding domain-containing protein, partial [Streptomyces noursei]